MSERRHWRNRSTAREGRRERARRRQGQRDARTPEQQLRLLDDRSGASARERARLTGGGA